MYLRTKFCANWTTQLKRATAYEILLKLGIYFTEIWWYNNFHHDGLAVVCHVTLSKFEIFDIRPSLLLDFALSQKISQKSDNLLPSYGQKRCCPIWRPSTILIFNIWILDELFLSESKLDSVYQISSSFTEIRLHDDFHISGRPPSWICDDVIMCKIEFHNPNTVRHFHVDWLVVFVQNSHVTSNRQRDYAQHHQLKPLPTTEMGLNESNK